MTSVRSNANQGNNRGSLSGRRTLDTDHDEFDTGQYSFFRGGPFYELQKRLHLVRKDRENSWQRAAIFVALAWGVPLLLSAYEGSAWGPYADRPYLLHLVVWARYFVSVGIFLLMEPFVGRRLTELLHRLVQSKLLAPGSKARAAEAVTRALKRSDAPSAELTCMIIGFTISVFSGFHLHEANPKSWILQQGPDGMSISLAAWWSLIVSAPIFWFLLARWVWRLIVFAMLLRDVAALDLRLVVTHPDGYGGIGFVGEYPNAYTPFIFAISCDTAAVVAEHLIRGAMQTATYVSVVVAWLLIIHVFISLPLFAFSSLLYELKRKTLEHCGIQATRFQRAVERKVLGKNTVAASDAEAAQIGEIPDPTTLFVAAKKMPAFLFSRATLLPVSAAALAPMLAAGATDLPLEKLLSVLKRLLLL
jgi:hypothetical protein